jgi:hypothetical protein
MSVYTTTLANTTLTITAEITPGEAIMGYILMGLTFVVILEMVVKLWHYHHTI